MSFNLLDAAKGLFTNELVGKASAFLGESESGVGKALAGILPSVIGGAINKAGEHGGADAIAKMASEQNDSGILGGLGNFFGGDSGSLLSKGAGLLGGLFGGGKADMLTSLISSFSGVKSSSAGSLLSMAAPAIMGLLGKHASGSGMGASGIASFLSSQKDSVAAAMPSGLNLSSVLGGFGGAAAAATGAISSMTGSAKSTVSTASGHVEESASGGGGAMKFLLPLLLLGAIAAGIWYFKNGCNGGASADAGHDKKDSGTAHSDHNMPATPTTGGVTATLPSVTIDSTTGLVKYDVGAPIDLELPGGVKLTGVAANGFESNLVNFIKTGTINTTDKTANWFDMFDVQFVSGKNVYTGTSAMQVKNTAAILKAYPNVKIKIGGYTDKSGDAAKNKALSQTRADKVKADLMAGGATAAQIVEAVGYGSEFAKAEATDKIGMARDRKVAVKVAEK